MFKFVCEKCGTLSSTAKGYCIKCGIHAFRKSTKDDYLKYQKTMKASEDTMNGQNVYPEIWKLAEIDLDTPSKMVDKQLINLMRIVKNDDELIKLLERKKAGEYVEDLISQNRLNDEKLLKEKEESSEEAIKWSLTEEAGKVFEQAAIYKKWKQRGLKLARINEKIRANEKEYKKLLEEKNKGDNVDDLINQNRYTAKILKGMIKRAK
jgi:hypothetical protein